LNYAIKKYLDFHQLDPRDIGNFPKAFKIPKEICLAGKAVSISYRSDKLNPATGADEGTIDYIHHHKDGVKLYRTDLRKTPRKVPKRICEAKWLVLIGDCLEFVYADEDGEVEAKARRPYPELYTIPSGKALLVVEGKRRVSALIWGGKLDVERRGIVG
jgi:hypothetical protein